MHDRTLAWRTENDELGVISEGFEFYARQVKRYRKPDETERSALLYDHGLSYIVEASLVQCEQWAKKSLEKLNGQDSFRSLCVVEKRTAMNGDAQKPFVFQERIANGKGSAHSPFSRFLCPPLAIRFWKTYGDAQKYAFEFIGNRFTRNWPYPAQVHRSMPYYENQTRETIWAGPYWNWRRLRCPFTWLDSCARSKNGLRWGRRTTWKGNWCAQALEVGVDWRRNSRTWGTVLLEERCLPMGIYCGVWWNLVTGKRWRNYYLMCGGHYAVRNKRIGCVKHGLRTSIQTSCT